ncbi:ABC transporter ATP-binding protein [Ruminococcus sp.]|uniref:ABC transporter ATP-binding protein n=1 Tax=Ruminococcus sp. TaxID=41978 RepID=UPI0025D1E2DA|nr:ABC transporter ATP-binding protein [Ruminococcus sp.]MBQ8967162.1 ABC transporter ATP-binding protein [Ruminococcus sp.]
MKDKKEKSWFGILLGYAEGSGAKLAGSVALSVISITCGILPFYCMYKIIDSFVDNRITNAYAVKWCLLALLAFAVKVLCFGLSTGLSHLAAFDILAALRRRAADRFLHAPLGTVQEHSIGEIKNIIVDKIDSMEPPLAHMVPEGAGHILLPVISIISLFIIDWRLALASLVTFPVAIICMGLTFKISGENFDIYNQSNAEMNSTIVEYIEGIEVIKAFGRTGVSYEKYAGAITKYKTFVIKWLRSTWVTMKLAFVLFPSTMIGILPTALWLCSRGDINAAQASLAVMLSVSMVGSLAILEVFSENMRQLKNNVLELQTYLEMEELPEPTARAEIKSFDVSLKNVHFSYTGDKKDEVLHGIDLELPQGSFTAVVGPSGGGKSTVAKLISRFWDVTEGSISIGGVNVKDIPLSQLADLVSFVTQDNFLFRTSLLENIRLGNPLATDEEVIAAARAAQCEDFIKKLPQGYDTPAGEAGKRLSGGEKQRIAIARMILKNAPIVILDEATAFTDPENEDKIQQSIAALTKGKTLLVIAHRLSTIKSADNIVLLKNGEINASGTQHELLEKSPLYRSMWQAHIGAKNWSVSSADKEGILNVQNA